MKKLTVFFTLLTIVCCMAACTPSLQGGQPEAEVVSNRGIAVRQGDYIYYINGGMPSYVNEALALTPQATIFRMKKDGTEKAQVSVKKAYDFIIVKDTIYFITPLDQKTLAVYATSINGGGDKKILTFDNEGTYAFGEGGVAAEKKEGILIYSFADKKLTELKDLGNVAQIFCTADKLYYYISNKAGIMETDYAGSEPLKLTDRNGKIVAVEGGSVYYFRADEKLTKHDISTAEETTMTASVYKTMKLSVKNSTIVAYSEDKDALFLMKLDGVSTRELLVQGKVNAYGISENKIFYNDADGKLYSVDYDGNNKKQLTDFAALAGPNSTDPDYYIDVVDDMLFIFDNQSVPFCINLTTGEVTNLQGSKNEE